MYKKLTLALFISLPIAHSFALDIIPAQSNYYYQMNGGSNFSLPPASNQQAITIGGGVGNQVFSCSGFNPAVSLTNGFNDMKDNLQALSQEIVNGAESASVGFGLSKL